MGRSLSERLKSRAVPYIFHFILLLYKFECQDTNLLTCPADYLRVCPRLIDLLSVVYKLTRSVKNTLFTLCTFFPKRDGTELKLQSTINRSILRYKQYLEHCRAKVSFHMAEVSKGAKRGEHDQIRTP